MKIYGISNCDTVKKARTYLEANSIPYQFHDYRVSGITNEKLRKWLTHVPLDKLLNKASTTWKELSEKQKAAVTTKARAIKIMISHPTSIKRPLLEDEEGEVIVLGFKKEIYDGIFNIRH